MKYLFYLLIAIFIISCENLFYEEENWIDSEYYIFAINPDGTENEEILLIDIYSTFIRTSFDGQKIVACDYLGQIRLIDIPTKEVIELSSDITTKPSFSHDSQNLVFTKQNRIILYNIETSSMNNIYVSNLDGFPVFSPNDEYIIFTTCEEYRSDYLISLKRINIDGTGSITLYSYIASSYSSYYKKSIYYPTFSPSGELFFVANGSLHKINLDGSGHQDFNISMDSKPISISPNGDLIVGIKWHGFDIHLVSADGMDSCPLYSGEEPSFISNQKIVYSRTVDDLRIGKCDGSGNTILTKGRFPTYCIFTSKIYYLKVKDIYE